MLDYPITRPSFRNLNVNFYGVAIDAKSVLTFKNRPLVVELRLKMSRNGQFVMFLISALSPKGAFQISTHFYHQWPLNKNNYVQIFESQPGYKITG